MAYATNKFAGNGVTTQFEISFAGGYIDKAHVKAYIENSTSLARTPVTVTADMFVGPNTINLGVSAPIGSSMVLYRDTPKDAPLVDYATGQRLTEASLDKSARQAVFLGAEASDLNGQEALVAALNASQAVLDSLGEIDAAVSSADGSAASALASKLAAAASALAADASRAEAAASAASIAGGPVTSVAGLTGIVAGGALKTALALVKGDVGLGNADNTSDAAKPVSTATQTALNLKADSTTVTSGLAGKTDTTTQVIAGNGMTGGGALSANRTLTLATPGTITPTSTNAATAGSHTHALDGVAVAAALIAGGIWATSGTTLVNTAPGYIRFPNGFTVQWGNTLATTNGSGEAAIPFPRTFTSIFHTSSTSGDYSIAQIVWANPGGAGNSASQMMVFGGNISGGNIVPKVSGQIRSWWFALGMS